MKWIFLILVCLAVSCRNSREGIATRHQALVDRSYSTLPFISSLHEATKIYPVLEGFPKLKDGTSYSIYFLLDSRYECVLTFQVSFEEGEISGYHKVGLLVNELEFVDLTESGSVVRGYSNNWHFSEDEIITLEETGWNLKVFGLGEEEPIDKCELVYRSWEFLYR